MFLITKYHHILPNNNSNTITTRSRPLLPTSLTTEGFLHRRYLTALDLRAPTHTTPTLLTCPTYEPCARPLVLLPTALPRRMFPTKAPTCAPTYAASAPPTTEGDSSRRLRSRNVSAHSRYITTSSGSSNGIFRLLWRHRIHQLGTADMQDDSYRYCDKRQLQFYIQGRPGVAFGNSVAGSETRLPILCN